MIGAEYRRQMGASGPQFGFGFGSLLERRRYDRVPPFPALRYFCGPAETFQGSIAARATSDQGKVQGSHAICAA